MEEGAKEAYIILLDKDTREETCIIVKKYISSIRTKDEEEGCIVRTLDGLDLALSQSVKEIFQELKK